MDNLSVIFPAVEYYVTSYAKLGFTSDISIVIGDDTTSVTIMFPKYVPDFRINHQGQVYGEIFQSNDRHIIAQILMISSLK